MLAEEESRKITEHLGDKKAIILQVSSCKPAEALSESRGELAKLRAKSKKIDAKRVEQARKAQYCSQEMQRQFGPACGKEGSGESA